MVRIIKSTQTGITGTFTELTIDRIREHLRKPFTPVQVDFSDDNWTRGKVPSVLGWYYLTTDAPLTALVDAKLWTQEFSRNTQIDIRAARFCEVSAAIWNKEIVYNGFHKNLKGRAKEHTFGHQLTGTLALHRYDALKEYNWKFSFLTMDDLSVPPASRDMVLRFGELLWRADNRWPLLCME